MPATGVLRIVVADDHDIVREGLRALLQSQPGWMVCDEAANGREAVTMALHHRPDVVVMDFSMPELNGLDATLQIRKVLPETEVLIVTMHDSLQLAQEVFKAGAHGFLLKSNMRRSLIPAVRALAEHKAFVDDSVSSPLPDMLPDPEGQRPGSPNGMERLTPRERETLQLVAAGKTSKEIARLLGLKTKTVEAHRANIMNKLNLHSVCELVRCAIRNKIVAP